MAWYTKSNGNVGVVFRISKRISYYDYRAGEGQMPTHKGKLAFGSNDLLQDIMEIRSHHNIILIRTYCWDIENNHAGSGIAEALSLLGKPTLSGHTQHKFRLQIGSLVTLIATRSRRGFTHVILVVLRSASVLSFVSLHAAIAALALLHMAFHAT